MAEPTIAAGFARGLMEFAIMKGADQQALVARSQINPDDLLDQDNRVALADYVALMDAAIDLSGAPALALQFGEAFTMPELSIVGLISQAAETVAEAFDQMNRYVRLILDTGDRHGDWFEIIRDQDQAWMALTSDLYHRHPRLAESAFARAMAGSPDSSANAAFARAVHFTFPEPQYSAEFDRIFKMPVVFGSDRNAFLVDRSFLSSKLPTPNRYVFGVLSRHADALLKKLEQSVTITGQVESLVIPLLHKGDVSMDQIARRLGLSRQTLYRKLKAENITFEKLLDNLRHQMALNYLNGKKVSVAETAYLVGFSDPTAFSRAFKRWTGKSPRAMRGA